MTNNYVLSLLEKALENYDQSIEVVSYICVTWSTIKPNTTTISARYQRAVLNGMIGMLLVFLSIPVVQNLLSSRQQMNTSFDSFRLVNTYGAFGR